MRTFQHDRGSSTNTKGPPHHSSHSLCAPASPPARISAYYIAFDLDSSLGIREFRQWPLIHLAHTAAHDSRVPEHCTVLSIRMPPHHVLPCRIWSCPCCCAEHRDVVASIDCTSVSDLLSQIHIWRHQQHTQGQLFYSRNCSGCTNSPPSLAAEYADESEAHGGLRLFIPHRFS